MAEHQSNQQCEHVGANEQKLEQKQDENDGNSVSGNEPKSLNNIYYDCLERIFDFLDLKSLLNVANTCKRLDTAARAKFGHEHGSKVVKLSHVSAAIEPHISADQSSISVYSSVLLPFLRCFGRHVSHLRYSRSSTFQNGRERYAQRYINQYCAETLITISFGPVESMIETFAKPFVNVREVTIATTALGNRLSHFMYWFPNMSRMKILFGVRDVDDGAVAVSFPHLHHLTVVLDTEPGNFTIERAAELLRANRQLESLNIQSRRRRNELWDLISQNESITTLTITCLGSDGVTTDEVNRLASEHSLLEELRLTCAKFTANSAITLMLRLNSLKRFVFRIEGEIELNRFLEQLDNKWQAKHDKNRISVELIANH